MRATPLCDAVHNEVSMRYPRGCVSINAGILPDQTNNGVRAVIQTDRRIAPVYFGRFLDDADRIGWGT
jgi:hypothetical protein